MIFEAYIFDLDGTLIDSIGNISIAANKTLKELGFEEKSPYEIKKYIGSGAKELFNGILKDKSYVEKAVDIFRYHYAQDPISQTKIFDGAFEVLTLLKEKDKKLAVVSNKLLEISQIILKALKLEDFFQEIVGPESYNERKPSPVPILKTIEKLNTIPDRTVVIGDTYIDIICAKNANCFSALASWGYVKLDGKKPDFVLNSFKDLLEL